MNLGYGCGAFCVECYLRMDAFYEDVLRVSRYEARNYRIGKRLYEQQILPNQLPEFPTYEDACGNREY